MNDKLSNTNQTVFEQNKTVDENGNEFWGARKLSKILEYSEFRHFLPVVERAKEAYKNSGYEVSDLIEDILDMIEYWKKNRSGNWRYHAGEFSCSWKYQKAL